jgi:hypothetical protein
MATPTNLPADFSPGQVLTAANMDDLRGAFRVLQVAQGTSTTMSSTSSSTLTDMGLSVSITPQSSSSQILVTATFMIGFGASADDTFYSLLRGSTAIGIGTAGTVTNASAYVRGNSSANQTLAVIPVTITFLDSPATTSATTYKMQWATRTNVIYLNRRGNDDNFGLMSTITVQEISA